MDPVIYNVLSIIVMAITGLLVGWRIRGSLSDAALTFALLLLFAYSISWVMAYIALIIPSVEVINNAAFVVIFPLSFVANTFVPVQDLPGPLQTFAEWNPVSTVTEAARELFGNIPPGTPEPDAWPLQNPELYTLIWVVVTVAVFATLAVRRYQKVTKTLTVENQLRQCPPRVDRPSSVATSDPSWKIVISPSMDTLSTTLARCDRERAAAVRAPSC